MELDNLQKVGNKYYLLFKGYEICNGLANDYLANRASVRAKDYVNAIKTVRGLIFEEIEKEKLN